MRLISLSIENFRAFRERQVFNFPGAPGLYFMQGRNESDPRLGGNGAGKSSIWEALRWLIDGKTSTGLKAGDICNWDRSKGVKVTLHYKLGDNDYFVTRTWGPISWTYTLVEDDVVAGELDLTKSEDNPFLADIGTNAATLQHSVMMAQGADMFLDLKRDAQAELFGQVLGLERWLEYSSKAGRLASAQDAICRRLEREVAELQGQLKASTDYTALIAEFEDKRQRKLSALDQDHAALMEQRARVKKDLAGLGDDRRRELAAAAASAKDAWKAMGLLVDDLQAELRDVSEEVTAVKARLGIDQKMLEAIRDDGTCPTCHQPITFHKKDDVDKLITKVTDLAKSATRLVDRRDALKVKVGSAADREDDKHRELQAKERDLEDFDRKRRELDLKLTGLDHQLDRIEEEAERAEAEPNPYRGLQKDAQDSARTTQERLLTARQGLDAAQEKFALYSLWVRGFKDLRLQQIADALTELEIEVNSSIAELGLKGWELRFEVDRETKSGSVQRGFAVTVISPHNPRAVPWESWSGGEKQRLRIAANMGLSNLIRSRMGVDMALEVWDEPSMGLSQEGVSDLLTTLERRARVEGRQIWIVDHTSRSFGHFAGEVTIVKDADGSRIEQG